jgi:predicted metal-dependent HD superfamily phosphohydrolase
MDIKSEFYKLINQFESDESKIADLWNDVNQAYTGRKRHYHDLSHLENLLMQLSVVHEDVENWNALLFTLYYHDIVYDAKKKNNEELSADWAKKVMTQIGVDKKTVNLTFNQIIATKQHETSANIDTNYFLDADLSILGSTWSNYERYYQGVREEYKMYPKVMYNPGRKKVMRHFLEMDRIFKTDYFYQMFEQSARANIQQEIDLL